MSKIRVLIVDDSLFIRKALQRIFESKPGIEVAGVARDGKEAIEKVRSLSPDVITLDIMMPGMDGIETLKILMETKPTPVLMLSQYTQKGTDLTLKALDLGAMDFIDKSSTGLKDFFGLAEEIISKIKAIAGSRPRKITTPSKTVRKYTGKGIIDVVAIGTSTGGPPALQILLPKFPREISFGLLIVQHMPHGFTGPLAKRLDTISRIHVKEADEGDKIEPGLALIAPSGLHMTVKREQSPHSPQRIRVSAEAARRGKGSKVAVRGKVKLDVEPSNTLHKPSVDLLFQSVAKSYGNRSLGVILTGMGSDGLKGMQAIKHESGITLAQDEGTSVIFGMPRAAIEKGVVDKVMPITSMAEEIMKKV